MPTVWDGVRVMVPSPDGTRPERLLPVGELRPGSVSTPAVGHDTITNTYRLATWQSE